MEFLELLKTGRPVLLDGGMGTMLQARGLPVGAVPELTALEHPDWLLDIHGAYLEAGSQVIYANTFGANREKLAHCGRTVEEIVPAAVSAARQAAQKYGALVALDVGPTGQLLEPTGTLEFETAVDIFCPSRQGRGRRRGGSDRHRDHDRPAGGPGRPAGRQGELYSARGGHHDL